MARILVAEDEPDLRSLVSRGLALDGHMVESVEDGGAALQALRRADPAFDLLLSDIKMPVMDGIQLALSAASACPAMPIVLMTGYAEQRERAHGLDALITTILQKPFSLDMLRTTVTQALAV